MIPGHDLRLQSMLRALNEVIIPAIEPGQQLAMDQAQILAGNLRILLAQHDKVTQFALVELREYAGLLRGLLAAAEGEGAAVAACEAARRSLEDAAANLSIDLPPQFVLTAQVAQLKACADAVVEAVLGAGSEPLREQVKALVFAQSGEQVLRERAWVAQSGFEAAADTLPDLDELLRLA